MRRITDWFRRRRSRTLTLPASGRALIVSDLHGSLHDWQAFLRRTEAFDRIAAGEDLYVVLTGDVPDVTRHRAVDPRVPRDGDVRILDSLVEARARLGDRGRRIVYVEGNHDFHVARIATEVARFQAGRDGRRPPAPDELPSVDLGAYNAFCTNYRDTLGDAIFQNNIAPYDMVPRARSEHLRFITSGPVLLYMEGAGVMVIHAGPPRMAGRDPRRLRDEIDRARPSDLATASPEEYFASPYHQLLNNRFRHGDYGLEDLEAFCAAYSATAVVSGHTPHPYLLDFERGAPLEHCAFEDGVGRIGPRQLVLCTSFGAFVPACKRYLDVDLTRRYADACELVQDAVRPLYPPEEAEQPEVTPLPGTEIALRLL
ncbi:MAG: metallophosphoesterase [Planctomycetota bacterium]